MLSHVDLPFGSVKVAVPVSASLFCTTSKEFPHTDVTRVVYYVGSTSLDALYSRPIIIIIISNQTVLLVVVYYTTEQPSYNATLKWGHPAPTAEKISIRFLHDIVLFTTNCHISTCLARLHVDFIGVLGDDV